MLLAIILAAFLVVVLLRRPPEPPENQADSSNLSSPTVATELAPPPEPPSRLASPIPASDQPAQVDDVVPPHEQRSVADLLTSGDLLREAVTPEVLAAYHAKHGQDAGALLTSFLAAADRTYLAAAAERYGDEPRVQLAMLMNDPPAEDRQAWLERFKASDPENALPNYLAAREAFEQDRPQDALRELTVAAAKDSFDPYTFDTMIDQQELLLEAGLSSVEANAIAMFSTPLPHLAELRELGGNVADLQQQYAAANDTASRDVATSLGLEVAGRLNHPSGRRFLIDQLVGIAIEDQLLQTYPPNAQPEFLSVPINVRRAELAAQKAAMKELAPLVDTALLQAPEATWATYLERMKLQGEWAALQWLDTQLGP